MNDNPIPIPPEKRPQDPFTAQDATAAFSALERKLETEFQLLRGQIANIQQKTLTILEIAGRIEAGLADSRINRLEIDLRDAELELEKAEVNKRTAEDRLRLKKEVKDSLGSTQERVRALASDALLNAERQKEEERKKRIDDLKFTALKSLVSWGSVAVVLVFLGFLWFLIQLYLKSLGSP